MSGDDAYLAVIGKKGAIFLCRSNEFKRKKNSIFENEFAVIISAKFIGSNLAVIDSENFTQCLRFILIEIF